MAEVAVIGAGSSGLAVLHALHRHGVAVACFERGSDVGGLWRYQNDNGLSSAYASLRANVSRKRMEYPGFPMPGSYGDFPGHRDMATYLGAYADSFGLRELIGFGATVERLEPDLDGSWRIALDDGSVRHFRAVVVATGHDWYPKRPDGQGGFTGAVSHSHDYRAPGGSRVAACWWLVPASRRPRSPWRSRGWRRAPSSPCGPAPTWSRAGSAGVPTTRPTWSRSTGCRGGC